MPVRIGPGREPVVRSLRGKAASHLDAIQVAFSFSLAAMEHVDQVAMKQHVYEPYGNLDPTARENR